MHASCCIFLLLILYIYLFDVVTVVCLCPITLPFDMASPTLLDQFLSCSNQWQNHLITDTLSLVACLVYFFVLSLICFCLSFIVAFCWIFSINARTLDPLSAILQVIYINIDRRQRCLFNGLLSLTYLEQWYQSLLHLFIDFFKFFCLLYQRQCELTAVDQWNENCWWRRKWEVKL